MRSACGKVAARLALSLEACLVTPSTRTILETLPKPRLEELGRSFAVTVPPSATREAQVASLVEAGVIRFRDLLAALGRDELKAACRSHGLDDSGRARPQLAARLLADLIVASGIPSDVLSSHAFSGELIEAVVERKPALVCISLVPPASLISARALYKRLRAKMPELPIVIGCWDERIDRERAQKRLGIAEQDRVVLTLSEALNVVRAVVPPMVKEEKPAPTVDVKPTAPRAVA